MSDLKTLSFSMTSPEFINNPYPYYEQLRSQHPIYRLDSFPYPAWYVTGYEEAVAILKDTRFQNRIPLPPKTKKYKQLKNIQENMMLFNNKSDHKRLRHLVSKAFTPKMVESYRPYIRDTIYELLQSKQDKETMDIISDFAFPLTSNVIAKILGVPEEKRSSFREWAAVLIQSIDFTRSRHVLSSGNDTTGKVLDYFKELVQERKVNPKEDLVSQLIKEEEKGDKLSDNELLSTCILLIIAGHETTVNLISNAVFSIWSHPDQLKKLQENFSLIETAVEECLRFESPTQMTARIASENITISGTSIQKGEHVYILLGAANRDPNIFKGSDKLDITRNPNPHLAFGYGSHFCLGASLARVEAQMAIAFLLERFPAMKVDTYQPEWRHLTGFRSLKHLYVSLQAKKEVQQD